MTDKVVFTGPKSSEPIKRFWAKVSRGSRKECWNYGLAKSYGTLRVDGSKILAHRYSWEIHYGQIPDGLYVLHKCDNPRCVNPEHLFLGTKLDNALDRDRKGRKVEFFSENHGRAKLRNSDVLEIRRCYILRHREFGQEALAKKYNVSPFTIYAIVHGLTWKRL